eukprot:261970-Amphidinium_carterae.1
MRVSVRPFAVAEGGALSASDAVLLQHQQVGLVGSPGPLQPVPCVAPAPAQVTRASILHATTSALQPPVLRASTSAIRPGVPAATTTQTHPAQAKAIASTAIPCAASPLNGQHMPSEQQQVKASPRAVTAAAKVVASAALPVERSDADVQQTPRRQSAGTTAKAAVPLAVRRTSGRMSSSAGGVRSGASPAPANNAKGAGAKQLATTTRDSTAARRAPQKIAVSGSTPIADAVDGSTPCGVQEERDEHGERGEGSAEALAALQAAQGIDDRTLVVFDFDRTIMKEHMWKKYRETDIAEIRITDDHFVDLHKFRALVYSIRMKGHNVAVATFGRRD